jgi:thiol:disulfide interchange protein DsbC
MVMVSAKAIKWITGPVILIIAVAVTLTINATDTVDLDKIKSSFEKSTNDRVKVVQIRSSPVQGLFEMQFDNSSVGYTDASGRYVILAPMIDVQTKKVVSELVNVGGIQPGARVEANSQSGEARAAPNVGVGGIAQASSAQALPRPDLSVLKGGITWIHGNGSQRLVVFSDPRCPHCRALDQVLRDPTMVTNVTVEVFPFPLRAMHPDAAAISAKVWCQSPLQQAKAWQRAIDNESIPEVSPAEHAKCLQKVDASERLGDLWGVTGTPTMFAANGERLSGAVTAAEIAAFLKANKQ